MNIIFMGTPDFAATSLAALIDANYKISAVFTQPDKPVGRHRILTPPPVKQLALENDIPVFQPEKLRDSELVEQIKSYNPDLIVVVAYGKIIPEEILSICPCINVHGSLLPKYRGAAPIQWSVINGEKYAGVTTMFMDKGLDTGDIILKQETEILEGETSGELFERLAKIGADLLIETVKLIESGDAPRTPQDSDQATWAPMLNKEMALIDIAKPANELTSLICGLNPWPVAYTFIDGKRFKIYRAKTVDKKGKVGEILDAKKLVVACGEGALELCEVQIEGSKAQSGEEFSRGRRLSNGDMLI